MASGADGFVGQGHHQLGGIGICKRKPVVDSPGNFFFMENAQHAPIPDTCGRDGIDPLPMTEAEFVNQPARTARGDVEALRATARERDGLDIITIV